MFKRPFDQQTHCYECHNELMLKPKENRFSCNTCNAALLVCIECKTIFSEKRVLEGVLRTTDSEKNGRNVDTSKYVCKLCSCEDCKTGKHEFFEHVELDTMSIDEFLGDMSIVN